MIPFATSDIVPSPPQAIRNSYPASAASRAIRFASCALSVNAHSKAPKVRARSLATAGQFLPVAPAADDGFMITNADLLIGITNLVYVLRPRHVKMAVNRSISVGKSRDLAHHIFANLFIGSHMILHFKKSFQLQLFSEVNTDFLAARPVSQDLLRQ